MNCSAAQSWPADSALRRHTQSSTWPVTHARSALLLSYVQAANSFRRSLASHTRL